MGKIRMESNFDPNADFVLYEGDAIELLSQIPDDFIQLIITSPPYNINKEYEEKLDLDTYVKQQEKII